MWEPSPRLDLDRSERGNCAPERDPLSQSDRQLQGIGPEVYGISASGLYWRFADIGRFALRDGSVVTFENVAGIATCFSLSCRTVNLSVYAYLWRARPISISTLD